jgi:hypothetical protein
VLDRRPEDLFIHPDDQDAFARRIADPLSPEARQRHIVTWISRDGEQKYLEWQFTPLASDESGGLPWLLGAAVSLHVEPTHA